MTASLRALCAVLMLCSAPTIGRCATPWWQHAVIYEIYVRSFQDSNGDGIGDLNGVTQRLDYLKQLGVDAIWLTPFYPSPNADFGYDVSDYENVASDYGTLADWDRLVREARKRGIRILVDLVLNHSSDQHPWFKESKSSPRSPKRDWYIWRDGKPDGGPPTNWQSIFGGSTWTRDETSKQWYYHVFLAQQPDLNWASPGLKKAMFDVVRFWLDRGAAGFRLDATPYLFEDPAWPDDPDVAGGSPVALKPYNSGRPEGHRVLRELRAIVDGYPGERVLLGESATASIEELAAVYGDRHDEINLPMNFLYAGAKRLDAGEFKRQIDDAETRLRGQPAVLFLSNHDRTRQRSAFADGAHDEAIAKLTAALTLTPGGTALVYYGEELGMGDMPGEQLQAFPLSPKRPRADERDRVRTPMQWSDDVAAGFTRAAPWLPVPISARHDNAAREQQDANSILRWYQRLLQLRRSNPALRTGTYLPLRADDPHVLAFARLENHRGILAVFNLSGEERSILLSGWPAGVPRWRDIVLATPAMSLPRSDRLTLAPYGVALIAF